MLRLTLCNLMNCSPAGSSRQEYWSGLPCPSPGDVPDTGLKPACVNVSCIGRCFFFFFRECCLGRLGAGSARDGVGGEEATELNPAGWKRIHRLKKCKRNFMEKDCVSMDKNSICYVRKNKSSLVFLEHQVGDESKEMRLESSQDPRS